MVKAMVEKISSQVFGLGLLALSFAIAVPVGFIFLDAASGLFALLIAVVVGAVAYMIWRSGKLWAKILGLVVAVGTAATGAIYQAFGVFQPFSPIEFVIGLLILLGYLYSVFGGTIAVVRHRSDRPASTLSGRLRQATLALIAVGAVVSIVGFGFTRDTVAEAQASQATLVDMGGFEYLPEDVITAQGQPLLFTNTDAWAHDFTLEQFDLYVFFGPGSEALMDLSALPPGTYGFFCSLHTFDGEGMVGTLTIES